jgi:hypothetical protein
MIRRAAVPYSSSVARTIETNPQKMLLTVKRLGRRYIPRRSGLVRPGFIL